MDALAQIILWVVIVAFLMWKATGYAAETAVKK
jgi:hypothetical protein